MLHPRAVGRIDGLLAVQDRPFSLGPRHPPALPEG